MNIPHPAAIGVDFLTQVRE